MLNLFGYPENLNAERRFHLVGNGPIKDKMTKTPLENFAIAVGNHGMKLEL
jgi:hypothetical protein